MTEARKAGIEWRSCAHAGRCEAEVRAEVSSTSTSTSTAPAPRVSRARLQVGLDLRREARGELGGQQLHVALLAAAELEHVSLERHRGAHLVLARLADHVHAEAGEQRDRLAELRDELVEDGLQPLLRRKQRGAWRAARGARRAARGAWRVAGIWLGACSEAQ